MTFAIPLGFIGLIGIPILIIIYILKPKFIERKISSTYIWKLSLKYRKRKIPLQWLKSFLLIVQCILVAILVFILTQPRLENKATGNESFVGIKKVILLDASSSMMTETNGVTRFQRAIEQINEIAETNDEGAEMTLITITDKAETVFDNLNNPSAAQAKISQLKCSTTDANYSAGVTAVLNIVKSGDKVRVVMFTDRDFEKNADGTNGFIEVRNMTDEENEWNVAVTEGFEGIISDPEDKNVGSKILIMRGVVYNRDITVVPCVDIVLKDSSGDPLPPKTVKLSARKLTKYDKDQYTTGGDYTGETEIIFGYDEIRAVINKRLTSYKSLKFYFEDTSGNPIGDSYKADNEFSLYQGDDSKFDVLVVDQDENDSTRSFIYMVVSAASGSDYSVTFKSPKQSYDPETGALTSQVTNTIPTEGFDLYIFDRYIPKVMPNDGSILIIDPQTTYGLPITVGGTTNASGTCNPCNPSLPSIQGGLAKLTPVSLAHEILYKVKPDADTLYTKGGQSGVFVYTRYTNVTAPDAQVLVETEDGKPLIITGVTDKRVKYTMFNFDLSFTDFPMIFDAFPQLVNNILDYSTSRLLEYYEYSIGDTVNIGVKPNTIEVVVEDSQGKKEVFADANDFPVEYDVKGGGSYTIKQKLVDAKGNVVAGVDENGNSDEYALKEKFYVRCDADESNFNKIEPRLVNTNPEVTVDSEGSAIETSTFTDLSKYFAAALIVLLLLEWGLQYREQY